MTMRLAARASRNGAARTRVLRAHTPRSSESALPRANVKREKHAGERYG
jgi:hypothetical protein